MAPNEVQMNIIICARHESLDKASDAVDRWAAELESMGWRHVKNKIEEKPLEILVARIMEKTIEL